MEPNCLFCKIVAGDIPCHRLYEDDRVLAFLDIGPLSTGHTLVIPRHHAAALDQLPDEDAAAIGRTLPKLAKAVTRATGTDAYNVLLNNGAPAGQEVMHVHFHIIPKPTDAPRTGGEPGTGLGIHWPGGQLEPDQAKQLIQKITDALA